MSKITHSGENHTPKKVCLCTPPLDTLAQLDHSAQKRAYATLKKRAIAKYYTNEILYPLIDLKNEREDMYWDTFHCVKTLTQDTDGKITSRYCKNRWCIVCNRIRTAILINKYKPILDTMETRFVTLTTERSGACKTEADLKVALDDMKHNFTRVWRRLKRKYGSVTAIRKIEITWNWKKEHFHPHFHVVLQNKSDEAAYLVKQWLSVFPLASEHAQDISVTTQNSTIELFKYFTKMWKRIENPDTQKETRVLPYPPDVMDTIFKVMYRQRTIQSYGGKIAPIEEDFDTSVATIFSEEKRSEMIWWNWEQDVKSWVNYDTGEIRTY